MQDTWKKLVRVLAKIGDKDEMDALLQEILTPKEVSDITLRWQLLKELHAGETQRTIAARHRISLCKITRGSKILKGEDSRCRRILDAEESLVGSKEKVKDDHDA